MPDINQIPEAARMQWQLALIERAIVDLKDGSLLSLTIASSGKPPVATVISLDPPLSDGASLNVIGSALQQQKEMLVKKLEELGFSYSETAVLPNVRGSLPPLPNVPPPPPPPPSVPLIPAPELPDQPAPVVKQEPHDPEPEPTEPTPEPESGTSH
jgi:hypothetical protein